MGTSLKKVAKKAKDYKYVLLVMRHAKTEPFGDGGDAGRELTDKGRKQRKPSPKAGRAQDGADAHCVLQRHQGQADLRSHAQGVRRRPEGRLSSESVRRWGAVGI